PQHINNNARQWQDTGFISLCLFWLQSNLTCIQIDLRPFNLQRFTDSSTAPVQERHKRTKTCRQYLDESVEIAAIQKPLPSRRFFLKFDVGYVMNLLVTFRNAKHTAQSGETSIDSSVACFSLSAFANEATCCVCRNLGDGHSSVGHDLLAVNHLGL